MDSCYGLPIPHVGAPPQWREAGRVLKLHKKRDRYVVLILGGARSGKSRYAVHLAEKWFGKPLYLATAEALDEEMAERIEIHKKARGTRWSCTEEPLDVAGVLRKLPAAHDGVLLDCVILWLSNVLIREGEDGFEQRRKELLSALRNVRYGVILVSNEVGMGIVPEAELGRKFRDLAGRLNQDLAGEADTVVLVTAGLPAMLKGEMPKRIAPLPRAGQARRLPRYKRGGVPTG